MRRIHWSAVAVAVAAVIGLGAPTLSGQVEGGGEPIVVIAGDPYSVVGMDLVRHMSQLLELDAEQHEILFGLHHGMMLEEQRIEKEHQERARELFTQPDQARRELRWSGFRMEQAMAATAKPFFADARLLALEDRIWIVDHIERRARARYCMGFMGQVFHHQTVAGLGAHPFDVLVDLELLDIDAIRELMHKHDEADRELGSLVESAFEARTQRTEVVIELKVDFLSSASDQELRRVRRAYEHYTEQVEQLRKANMAMAEALRASLPQEYRGAFEAAWLKENYAEIQLISDDSRIDRIAQDPELDEATRAEVNAIIGVFRARMQEAARRARESRYQLFAPATFEEHLHEELPDRSA
ncbi:MAG: hypothetical protein ACNA8P_05835, partial [Phycisphaerales bacterium]